MRIFVLWRRDTGPGADLDPAGVAGSLQEVLAPLFASPPPVRVESNEVAAMAFVQLPVRGWKASFVEDDVHGRAYCVDYPIGAARVLADAGVRGEPDDAVLPALGRALRAQPRRLLRELAPPFSLVWWPRDGGEVMLQNDALGEAQLFEYDDGSLWAATNKISALRALGVELTPDPVGWAMKCTSGWFPLAESGVRNVAHLTPGTQVRIDRAGVHRHVEDVLREWVNPEPMSQRDALELGRTSLIRHIRDGAPHWQDPLAELSGGWDSRAVVSSFLAAGVDVRVRVKGREGKFDRAIAQKLTEIAGLDLSIKEIAELPPPETDELERSLRLALLWQSGHMWSERHKAFLWQERYVDGGRLNIMGQHGEIGRGYYEKKLKVWEAVGEHEQEDRAVAYLMKAKAPGIRAELRQTVRERVREMWRQAGKWGLSGFAALDFLYLFERTRRRNAASVSAQFGLVFTPFLNPDYIRASYALRAAGCAFLRDRRQLNPLHRHIIETNMPAWMDVEFEGDLLRATKATHARAPVTPSHDWRRVQVKQYYDYDLYWEEVGAPLVDRVTASDGFWTEVFDPDAISAQPSLPPVELVLVQFMAESLERVAV